MKRTLEDIRENMPFVGCDNETALELCSEVERLTQVIERIHHFATGTCDMTKNTRLRCIAGECEAARR